MTTIRRAINLATRLHDKTCRKGGGLPYIAHPARVAAHLSKIYPSDYQDERSRWTLNDIIMAGWCHDLLEDADIDQPELYRELGNGAACLVRGMTNIKYDVGDRAQQKFLDRQRVCWESNDACVIKLVDRLDNVQDMDGMGDDFKTLYAMESVALVDSILASTDPSSWHGDVLKKLGQHIGRAVEEYLPRAVEKDEEIPNVQKR